MKNYSAHTMQKGLSCIDNNNNSNNNVVIIMITILIIMIIIIIVGYETQNSLLRPEHVRNCGATGRTITKEMDNGRK